MTVKSRRTIRSQSVDTSKTSAKNKSGVVDAIILQQSNLTVYLALQNLLNFFVDRINALFIDVSGQQAISEEITCCISHLNEFYLTHKGMLGGELAAKLYDFIEDAHSYELQISTIISSVDNATSYHAIGLSSKASYLQWLSVCIIQEMKRIFMHE